MEQQQHTADRLAVAASRALQLISESAHARAQSSAPTTPQPNHNKDDILDLFMSPDKPKSSLRQRAENSAKKFNPTVLLDQDDQPQHIILGIPKKPSPDLTNLTNYKPPTRRSIGPRRTSAIIPRRHSASPSKKPPIEALLNHLDILDHSRSSKSPFHTNNTSPPPKSNKKYPASTTSSRSSSSKIITSPEALESSTDPNHPTMEHTQTSMPEDTKPTVTHDEDEDDDDDNESDDSFDPNVLLVKAETVEDEQDSSIIIKSTRPSTRKRTGTKPKRVIPDSDEEDDKSSTSFVAKSPKASATSKKPSAPRRSLRNSSSLRASHSKQKSGVNQIIDVDDDDTESDDSIEIAPSRAIQFQKLRAQALTTDSNLIIKTVPQENVNISTQNDRRRVIASEESSSDDIEIQIRPTNNGPKSSSPQPTKVNQVDKPSKAKVERATKTQDAKSKKQTPQPKKQPATNKKAQDGLVPFAQVREKMAKDLVIELNKCVFKRKLPPIQLVWSNRLNSTAGRAHLLNTTDAAGNRAVNFRVELALKVVDNPARLRNTLAHELCHIACWTIDKRLKENHGRFFKAWGQRVHAAMPDITITTRHNYDISYKFKWSCDRPDCTRVYGRHSDSIKPERQRCLCGGGLIAILRRGKAVAIPPPAASSRTVPESDVELLIELDSCGSCPEADGPSDPASSPSKSLLNPYLSELEELDPSPFTNEYLNQLTHLDPRSFESPHPTTTSTTTSPVPVDHLLLVEQFVDLKVTAS